MLSVLLLQFGSPSSGMRVLPHQTVADLLDIAATLPPVEEALIDQYHGVVERPERPHFPIGTGLDGPSPLGLGLTMPAYIHGYPYYSTKLASYHEDNPKRGYPTLRAQIMLTDVQNGDPVALLAGTRVTNIRTGCIGGLAARELASNPVRLGVLGAGTQARWQTRAIAATREIASVTIYSPSDSREACAADLRADGIPATAVDTPRAAVEDATVVVTATTSTDPVFPADGLTAADLVIAVGSYTAELQELAPAVVEEATHLYADVPTEAAETGDFIDTPYGAADLAPLGGLLAGEVSRPDGDGYVVMSSVGTAVLDLAAASVVYEQALSEDRGTSLSLGSGP